ncbi:MAG: acyl-CoA/acyl-ACP dehydrogenase [Devosia nanyangense]|uniref:Acyl-CoA/acyl-ACP dehydrogenase n=1 Tax=Devosia nanyangense TaxID=1228055 RepID=A0A933L1Y1_9HYPH|nr:acyl-CoA/acyl-ACP dehydrogenase [Devosia nanyangense]
MDFTFTQDQTMMADVARDLLDAECPVSSLRALSAAGEARDAARWRKIVDLGLLGVLVPEAAGGLGLAEIDLVLIAEHCGYFGLPEPLVDTAGIALPLLAALPDVPRAAEALERTLAGESTVAIGHPGNPFVLDADAAGAILLPVDGALHLVDRADAKLTAQPSIDPFRKLFRVEAEPSAATLIADAEAAAPLLTQVFNRGALFAAAQLLGLARRSNDLAVAYAGERTQFGKPIGAYQAIKHHLATVQVKIEFARPVVYAAAAISPASGLHEEARISHAKLAAGEAADLSARTAVQVHGAMGYSWEVDVHYFLKRTLALSGAWGTPNDHRKRAAARVFGAPVGPEHTFTRGAAHG